MTCVRVDLVDEVGPVGQNELLEVAVQAEVHDNEQLSCRNFTLKRRYHEDEVSICILGITG